MKDLHSQKEAPGAGGKRQTKFKGLVADARALGVTRVHLWRVLTGRCEDNKGLLKRYHAIKTHGAPYLNKSMNAAELQTELLRRLDEIMASQKRLMGTQMVLTKAQENIEAIFRENMVAVNARLAALSEEEIKALAAIVRFPEVLPVRKQVSQDGAKEPEK
jgi:hypothetical protein